MCQNIVKVTIKTTKNKQPKFFLWIVAIAVNLYQASIVIHLNITQEKYKK